MARTALYSTPCALLLVWSWLRLERPSGVLAQALVIAALGIAPALVRGTWLRLGAFGLAFLVAAYSAFGVSPFDARPFDDRDFFGPLLARPLQGFLDFYDVALPFSAGDHGRMHGVVLLAVFWFCAAVALAVAVGRPLAAALALVTGVGWPAALLPGDDDVLRGALLLAVVLALLAGLRPLAGRRFAPAAAAATFVVLAAVAASSAPAVAKDGFVDWRRWDLYDAPQRRVSVSYVWDSSYRPIRFPKRKTTVLRVRAPERIPYFRATALDAFVADRWIEDLVGEEGPPSAARDPLLPPSARNRATWVAQEVTVGALRDDRLIAASVPVAFQGDGLDEVQYHRGGVVFLAGGLRRNQRYSAWSYAPQPRPAQLARSRARYPEEIAEDWRYLSVGPGLRLPPFGSPGRERFLAEFFRARGDDARVAPYRPLYRRARRLVGRARSPYAAAVALESWFRRTGGFTYDERPPAPRGAPLADFVLRTRRGHCQYYAGALALMLRYLGVPARVAAGFTSGTYDPEGRAWTVTDHDAHTWVEVWFSGYGWLPFDPTPGRGRLPASYTAASLRFDASGAAQVLAGTAGLAKLLLDRRNRDAVDIRRDAAAGEARSGAGANARSQREAGEGPSLLSLVLLALLGLAAIVVLTKLTLRRLRYVTRDPRRLAVACRRELCEFVLDQRIDVPESATLIELGSIVESELAVNAKRFVAAAGAARFGSPGSAADEARRAKRELRLLQRRIRRALTIPQRVRGAVSLRSLGTVG